MRVKLSILLFAFFLLGAPVFAQVNESLGPYINQISAPPENCNDAFSFVAYDSIENKITLSESLDTLEKFFNETYDKLNLELQKIKNKAGKKGEKFSGKNREGIPQDVPPDEEQIPSGMTDLMKDFRKADELQVKLNETDEKMRTDCALELDAVNHKLKKTLASDVSGQIQIVNDFLKDLNSLYNKFAFDFRENFKAIDEICKKYNYGQDFKMPTLKKKILEMQIEQMNNLRLLLSCTKSAIEIGSKFYIKSK